MLEFGTPVSKLDYSEVSVLLFFLGPEWRLPTLIELFDGGWGEPYNNYWHNTVTMYRPIRQLDVIKFNFIPVRDIL